MLTFWFSENYINKLYIRKLTRLTCDTHNYLGSLLHSSCLVAYLNQTPAPRDTIDFHQYVTMSLEHANKNEPDKTRHVMLWLEPFLLSVTLFQYSLPWQSSNIGYFLQVESQGFFFWSSTVFFPFKERWKMRKDKPEKEVMDCKTINLGEQSLLRQASHWNLNY